MKARGPGRRTSLLPGPSRLHLAPALLPLSLAGCGGSGGGSSTASTTAATVPSTTATTATAPPPAHRGAAPTHRAAPPARHPSGSAAHAPTADGATRHALAATLAAYFAAAAASRFPAACAYLSPSAKRALRRLAAATDPAARGCASILASRAASSRPAAPRLTRLRLAGDLALVHYRFSTGPARLTLLKRQGGRWRFALAPPSALP